MVACAVLAQIPVQGIGGEVAAAGRPFFGGARMGDDCGAETKEVTGVGHAPLSPAPSFPADSGRPALLPAGGGDGSHRSGRAGALPSLRPRSHDAKSNESLRPLMTTGDGAHDLSKSSIDPLTP